jgi:DNA-binding NarL/FixJ family response regulator
MDAGQVKVLVVDDHDLFRTGLRALLEDEGFSVVDAAGGAAGIRLARTFAPQVVVMDMNMPGMSGVEATPLMLEAVPGASVLMLTIATDEAEVLDAVRAGASGYLLKDADPTRLPHALRGVLDGEAALPRTLTARLIEEFRERGRRRRLRVGRQRAVELTPREWDVLELLNERRSTAEMAERLSVSPVTIRRHVSEILRKLRVPDRSSALRLLAKRSDL